MRDRMITVNMFENKIIGYPIGMSKNIFYKFFEKKYFLLRGQKISPWNSYFQYVLCYF